MAPTIPALSGRPYCPSCGYDQNGTHDSQDSGRCPECGCEWLRKNLLAVPPYGPVVTFVVNVAQATFRVVAGFAIAGFVFFVVAVLLTGMSHTSCRSDGRSLRAATMLRQIHQMQMLYANDNGNIYPNHAALLIAPNYFRPEIFEDRRVNTGPLMAGTYDLAKYDWTPADEQALQAAINVTDLQQPYYRVGDYWLTRLPRPTGDPNIIAGWTLPDKKGQRILVFDDSHIDYASPATWQKAWQADAQARLRLNLSAAAPPP